MPLPWGWRWHSVLCCSSSGSICSALVQHCRISCRHSVTLCCSRVQLLCAPSAQGEQKLGFHSLLMLCRDAQLHCDLSLGREKRRDKGTGVWGSVPMSVGQHHHLHGAQGSSCCPRVMSHCRESRGGLKRGRDGAVPLHGHGALCLGCSFPLAWEMPSGAS